MTRRRLNAVVVLAVSLVPHAARAQPDAAAQVGTGTWGPWIQESGKNTGGSSTYTCPDGQAMIGRQHSGDENGNTRYQCAGVTTEGFAFSIPGSHGAWGPSMQESGKNTGGTSSYTCPINQVMVGRQHSGDENGDTRYRCVAMTYNGVQITLQAGSFGPWIQESGKNTGGTSSYTCPQNQVMVGRRHQGDENGNTAYLCATILSTYKTTALRSQYAGESTACVWQDLAIQRCPPFVTYLTEALRTPLRLTVRGNLLYNSYGRAFDTSSADDSHTGPAAIFVMSAFGNVYASNVHPVYMFHHSSFFAGQPVASAGELYSENGVVQGVTNCSGHYQPSESIGRQLVGALQAQGYTRTIPFKSCTGMDMDYLTTGISASAPAALAFPGNYVRLLGPGTTAVCTEEEGAPACTEPESLRVPSGATVVLCAAGACSTYPAGEHRLPRMRIDSARVTLPAAPVAPR